MKKLSTPKLSEEVAVKVKPLTENDLKLFAILLMIYKFGHLKIIQRVVMRFNNKSILKQY